MPDKSLSLPLGQRIRYAREAVGMTQKALAESIGTTQAQIVRYESGEQDPTVNRLKDIARILGVTAGSLID